MYITLDGNYGVQKVDMTVSSNANLKPDERTSNQSTV